jgi:hypothetical protein
MRRFLLGCPPRKASDTSLGDAYNWEWMVACAIEHHAELVILSRDTDYGLEIENKMYLNDHLKQEFSERVSHKRKVHLCNRISAALKLMGVTVTDKEVAEEEKVVKEHKVISLAPVRYVFEPGGILTGPTGPIIGTGTLTSGNAFILGTGRVSLLDEATLKKGPTGPA